MTLDELLENVKLEGEPYIKVVDYDMASSKDEFGYDFKENYREVCVLSNVWNNSGKAAIIHQDTSRVPGLRRNRATWYK